MPDTLPDQAYMRVQTFPARLGGQEISYCSKPGLPNWNQISPATTLLVENVELSKDAQCMYFGCGHGAGPVALAQSAPTGRFYLTDIFAHSLEMTRETVHINGITNASVFGEIELPEVWQASFDNILIEQPKGRKLAQRWLVQAFHALRPGGRLYLAGSNQEGIQSTLKDGQEIFGPAAILAYKKGNRIARYQKTPDARLPAWAAQPGVAPGTWHRLYIEVAGLWFEMVSLPGIFAYDRLDPGTSLLLQSVPVPAGSRLLDLGCGYGLVGLYHAVRGAEQVDLIDVNLLAVAAARKNLAHHQVSCASVEAGDALQPVANRRYDFILTNPPFHAGKSIDYQMAQAFIVQSWEHLEPGGHFALVANKFIRYDGLIRAHFAQTYLAAEAHGYQVWIGIK